MVDKFLLAKFPVSLVLMELAFQMAQLNATLSLSWIPREQNPEADDFTKDRFEKFSACILILAIAAVSRCAVFFPICSVTCSFD